MAFKSELIDILAAVADEVDNTVEELNKRNADKEALAKDIYESLADYALDIDKLIGRYFPKN